MTGRRGHTVSPGFFAPSIFETYSLFYRSRKDVRQLKDSLDLLCGRMARRCDGPRDDGGCAGGVGRQCEWVVVQVRLTKEWLSDTCTVSRGHLTSYYIAVLQKMPSATLINVRVPGVIYRELYITVRNVQRFREAVSG